MLRHWLVGKAIILKKYGNVFTVQIVQAIIVQRQAMKLASSKNKF